MNTNDAFSAFRLEGYNNFLLADDGVDIYAIGLNRVPKRNDWIVNPKRGGPNEPVFGNST